MDNSTTRLHFLEHWLPMAQSENERCGWGDDGPALERLLELAAPHLRTVTSAVAARAILRHYRRLLPSVTP